MNELILECVVLMYKNKSSTFIIDESYHATLLPLIELVLLESM